MFCIWALVFFPGRCDCRQLLQNSTQTASVSQYVLCPTKLNHVQEIPRTLREPRNKASPNCLKTEKAQLKSNHVIQSSDQNNQIWEEIRLVYFFFFFLENLHKLVCTSLAEGCFAAKERITSGVYCNMMQSTFPWIGYNKKKKSNNLASKCFQITFFTFHTLQPYLIIASLTVPPEKQGAEFAFPQFLFTTLWIIALTEAGRFGCYNTYPELWANEA